MGRHHHLHQAFTEALGVILFPSLMATQDPCLTSMASVTLKCDYFPIFFPFLIKSLFLFSVWASPKDFITETSTVSSDQGMSLNSGTDTAIGTSHHQAQSLSVKSYVSRASLVMKNRPMPTKFPIHMDDDFYSQSH